jgi:DNA integrity scanning protein DisA with diadenylate cyclase activity
MVKRLFFLPILVNELPNLYSNDGVFVITSECEVIQAYCWIPACSGMTRGRGNDNVKN